jgi:uncharacterized protein YneF (UPF0154 family)
MKLILILVVVALVVGSFLADYKWRKWMAERKRERE